MSGYTNLDFTMNEHRRREYQKMVEKIRNNSVAQSTNESVHESRLGHSVVNTTQQPYTLPTLQFYPRESNTTSSQCNNMNLVVPTPQASNYDPSEASVFKLPQTTSQFRRWSTRFEYKMGVLNEGLRSLENKSELFKFFYRLNTVGLQICKLNTNGSITNIPELSNEINSTVIELYYSNIARSDISSQSSRMSDRPMSTASRNIPKPDMSLSSRVSDRPVSMIEPFGNIQMSSELRDRLFPSSQPMHLHKINNSTNVRPEQDPRIAVAAAESARSVNQPSESFVDRNRRPYIKPKPSIVPEELDQTDCLFNESTCAQRRDEIASKQPATFSNTSFAVPQQSKVPKIKPTPRPKSNNTRVIKANVKSSVRENTPTLDQNSITNPNNSTMIQAKGTRGVSRSGRQLRSPAQFWKGLDSTNNETAISDNESKKKKYKDVLNQSMTLRNNKVVDKVSPPLKISKSSKQNTPLTAVIAEDNVTKVVKKQTTKKTSAKKDSDKENSEFSKKKPPPKKQNAKKVGDKTTSSKQTAPSKTVKTNKQQESVKQIKQTMASKKRKSMELDNVMAKKKKIEEKPLENSSDMDSDDDELFGTFTYKKTTQPAFQALSPNTGMLSVKKAAGVPLGKETPPCKALGLMINVSGHSAASSVTKEVPLAKGAQVVKRVTKNLEKDQKKVTKKPPKKNNKKEDQELNKVLEEAVKYTYTSRTPQSTAVYTMFRGQEPETDSDYVDDDDDDDDLN